MFAPIRSMLSVRRGAPAALIVGAASVSFLFGATPFLIPEVADRLGVSLGVAGLISSAQVLGFAGSVFVAGRRLSPSRGVLVWAAVAAAAFDVASGFVPSFGLLLVLRLGAGVAAGLLTWLAWADAMRSSHSMRDIAAIGPLTVLFGAPLLGWVGSVGGDRALYLVLAASMIPPMLIPVEFVAQPMRGRHSMSPSRTNLVLLGALGCLTMAGSALFVFLGAFADIEIGLTAVALSLGFSVNVLAGLIAAGRRRRPRYAWPWLVVTAVSATSIVLFPGAVVFYAGMFGWGFAFWMAVPRVLGRVAEWSLVPDERVGDAQSIMALGRAAGPAIGGTLVGSGDFGGLVVFAGAGLLSSAILTGSVEVYRRDRAGPSAGHNVPHR